MASSYSDLGLELMVTGENAGTWGDKTNSNLNLINQAIGGYEAITLTSGGTVTLAMTDGQVSTARNMIIKFATATIAASTVVTVPNSIEKFYIFDCSGLTNPANLTIKTASGSGFSPDSAKIYAAYSDGTNIVEVSLDTLGGTIGSAQLADNSVLSAAISANQITTAKISDNQITTAKISDNQILTAKISNNQITTAKVSDLQITTAKINDDAVTADKLADTAVTAGSYTLASITVDGQGRLTAASAGASGGGVTAPTFFATSGSGTYTSPSPGGGTSLLAYIAAGGGAAGAGTNCGTGGSGGNGGFGSYKVAITQPFSAPYSVGGSGTGSGGAGNAGGATNFSNFTANGGTGGNPGGGNPGTSGNAGSAPGSTLDMTNTMGGSNENGYHFNQGTRGLGRTSPGPGNSGKSGALYIFEA